MQIVKVIWNSHSHSISSTPLISSGISPSSSKADIALPYDAVLLYLGCRPLCISVMNMSKFSCGSAAWVRPSSAP